MDPAEGTQPQQDNPLDQSGASPTPGPQQPQETGTTPEAPDYGNLLTQENFDPASLPEELRPAYNQLRADYTRKTQDLAAQRTEAEQALAFVGALNSDEDRAQALASLAEAFGPEAILEALGYELDGNGTPSGQPAPPEAQQPFADPRVDQIMERFSAEDQARQEAELVARIEAFAENEFTRLGVDDDDVKELILGRAAVYELDSNGLPQIEAAAKDVGRVLEAQRAGIFAQKGGAPAPPVSGSPGQTQQVDFSDADARQAHMARLMQGQT